MHAPPSLKRGRAAMSRVMGTTRRRVHWGGAARIFQNGTSVGARAGHYQTQGPHIRVKADAIKTFSFFVAFVERWRCRLQKLEGRAFQLHGVERLYTEKK